MKKSLWLIGVIIFLMITVLSGCLFGEQEAATVQNNFEGITFESSVFELVDASLDFYEKRNVVTRVDVKYLFRNIAGRAVYDVKVTVEFYDKNNNLLAVGGPKFISLAKGYTEQGIGLANIISYSGEKVSEVDHVSIIAEE